MRRRAAFLALTQGLSVAATLSACPCQGSSDPTGAVTSQADRFGVSLTETARTVEGAFRSNGVYAPLATGNRQWRSM